MSSNPEIPPVALGATHRRRLRAVWRSAGWPCQDLVEVELLACGLLERLRDAEGRETLRVTDAGIQVLARTVHQNRRAFDAHESLVARVALEMQRAGRIVWRGLSVRAPVDPAPSPVPVDGEVSRTRWVMAAPDVFSIRHTTLEDHVEPIVHEVKVRRADLLADLKRPDKRAAYLALSGQCWYVLRAGIGTAEDVPPECGVLIAHPAPPGTADAFEGSALEVLRAAPRRAHRLPLSTWMALARATAEPPPEEDPQATL